MNEQVELFSKKVAQQHWQRRPAPRRDGHGPIGNDCLVRLLSKTVKSVDLRSVFSEFYDVSWYRGMEYHNTILLG